MKYIFLLLVSLIFGLCWYYYEYVYPVPDEQETLPFGIECDFERLLIADERKSACLVVIAFCVFLAAIFGASEW